MKVLWIADIAFPDVYSSLGKPIPVHAGWVHASAKQLLSLRRDIQMSTAVIMNLPELQILFLNGVKHYIIPSHKKANSDLWKFILDDFNPEVVHVHGTEYPYLYNFIKARESQKLVLSIQGLVSIIERYYYGGISPYKLLLSVTFRDIIKLDTLFHQRWGMRNRGIAERLAIRSVDAVIGRTEWDKVHALAINPSVSYYHNNETLRSVFYSGSWHINSHQPYRIFMSQAHYPIKGLHQLLFALPQIIAEYPQTEVYIAGHDFFNNRGIKLSGYGNYINSLIRTLNLKKYIHFTGLLTADEMKQQYLSAHVFVCPSAIENSPNSLGEAQMLGTPVIAAYAGGISSMVEHQISGLLYRFEESEHLAAHILNLFSDKELCELLSNRGKLVAAKRHNAEHNAQRLFEIYQRLHNL